MLVSWKLAPHCTFLPPMKGGFRVLLFQEILSVLPAKAGTGGGVFKLRYAFPMFFSIVFQNISSMSEPSWKIPSFCIAWTRMS